MHRCWQGKSMTLLVESKHTMHCPSSSLSEARLLFFFDGCGVCLTTLNLFVVVVIPLMSRQTRRCQLRTAPRGIARPGVGTTYTALGLLSCRMGVVGTDSASSSDSESLHCRQFLLIWREFGRISRRLCKG